MEHPSNIAELSLIVVYVSDMEKALSFYGKLGMRFEKEKHGDGPEHYATELESTVFEIYPRPKDAPPSTLRIGFRLAAMDEVLKHLEQNGVPLVSQPKDTCWGRRAIVQDPDGNKIELTQQG